MEKFIGAIAVVVIFGFIGFVAVVMTALMGGHDFYAPLIAVVTVGFIVFLIMKIYKQTGKKKVRKSFIIFASLCVVAVIGYEIYQVYLDRLDVEHAGRQAV